MNKLTLIITGVLLSTISFGQIPFSVDKILEIIDGDTIEIQNPVLTYVGVKYKKGSGIKLFFEAKVDSANYNYKFRSKKLTVVEKTFNKGENGMPGWGGSFVCYSDELGSVEIIHDWLNGEIRYKDDDGELKKIIVLKPY